MVANIGPSGVTNESLEQSTLMVLEEYAVASFNLVDHACHRLTEYTLAYHIFNILFIMANELVSHTMNNRPTDGWSWDWTRSTQTTYIFIDSSDDIVSFTVKAPMREDVTKYVTVLEEKANAADDEEDGNDDVDSINASADNSDVYSVEDISSSREGENEIVV